MPKLYVIEFNHGTEKKEAAIKYEKCPKVKRFHVWEPSGQGRKTSP